MKAKPLLLIVLALLASLTTPASALTPQGRQITGTIAKVDAPNREVEMFREDSGAPASFIWNRHTSFIAASQFTDAIILKKGARITVSRHAPFFRKPFVTKVTLQPSQQPKPKNQTSK